MNTFPLRLFCLAALLNLLSAGAAPMLISHRDGLIGTIASGNADSGMPVISSDGRYVLFASAAGNLVTNPPAALPFRLNLFLCDRTAESTVLVSASTAGSYGNGDSLPGGISADGRYVAFESAASNLVTNDNNKASDIFVRDLLNNTTRLISVSPGGTPGNGASRSPVMTPNGRYVAFVSDASNLAAGDINGIADIFVADLQTGVVTLASTSAKATTTSNAKRGSETPAISNDGRFVAFFSFATNLVPSAMNSGEVYVRDLQANTTTWASTNGRSLFESIVGSTNVVSCNLALSSNGQHVAFLTCANPVIGANARALALRYNLANGTTDIVHTNANVASSDFAQLRNLSMSPDGNFIAFIANASAGYTSVQRWSAQTGVSTVVSAANGSENPATGTFHWPIVSADGDYVAFVSAYLNSPPVAAELLHLYVRDVPNWITEIADVDLNGSAAGILSFTVPALSGDGRVAVFEALDANYVADDRNACVDVFARNLSAQTTELISSRDASREMAGGNGISQLSSYSVSSNGNLIVFGSDAADLIASDTDNQRNSFVHDLLSGMNTRIDVNILGTAGFIGSTEPAINRSGTHVAYSSVPVSPVSSPIALQVYLQDLQTSGTVHVSVSTNGVSAGNNDSFQPVASEDGRFVMFRSRASNLTSGAFGSGIENLFVRDVQLGTNYALTAAQSGVGVTAAQMTPDGRYVAFIGLPAGQATSRIYIWDSQTKSRIYTNTAASPTQLAISADGNRLAYLASGTISVANVITKINAIVGSAGTVTAPNFRISDDGRYLAYVTSANSGADANGLPDIYRYDFNTGTRLLVNRRFDSAGIPTGSISLLDMTTDGRFVVFRSSATNVVPGDANGFSDIFLFDCTTSSTLLISQKRNTAATATGASTRAQFSADCRTLVIQSSASDLSGTDNNLGALDIFAIRIAVEPIVDTDSDGMDDNWEQTRFETMARDGTEDFDGDHASDLDEFLAGTDPKAGQSVLQVQIRKQPGGVPELRWPVAEQRFYRLQFKNALSDASWQDVAGTTSMVNGWGSLHDFAASPQRLYRVMVQP